MYNHLEKTLCIVLVLMVFIWCVVAANVHDQEKGLKLKSNMDSVLETNGTQLLQIGNFKGSGTSNLNEKRISRRSVGADSSSKSEENIDDKEEKDDNSKQNRQSDTSDDADSSVTDSDENRGISTKGLVPEDFEPERNPKIHERESKDSGSE